VCAISSLKSSRSLSHLLMSSCFVSSGVVARLESERKVDNVCVVVC